MYFTLEFCEMSKLLVYFSLHKNIFVLKKGTRKMNKLKELRNKVKKNNKGFSLVELIVVIVILAILIGVTIGGIYQYVNKSRINTDINNAASIQSVLAAVATDADVNKVFKTGQYAIIDWDDAKKILLRLMFWLRCGCWSIAQTVYY